MEEEEFFPCTCCGTRRQTDTGFCEECNAEDCAAFFGKEPGSGST